MTWHIDYFQCEGGRAELHRARSGALQGHRCDGAKSKNTVHLWELVNEDLPPLFIVLALSITSLDQ